jgi:hypothetical protein
MNNLKKRLIYLVCFILIIPIGLSTRKYGAGMPYIVATYGGDVLYATCMFFFLRVFWVKPPVWKMALYAFIACICVEVQQLYQAPWIIKLRHTPPFGLILGYGFLWSDCLCYAVGSLLGCAIGCAIEKKRNADGKD